MNNDQLPEPSESDIRGDLLELAHGVGTSEQMAILGEGNVSGRLDSDQFLIKASGTQMGTLAPEQLVLVHSQPILESLASEETSDEAVDALLLASRVNPDALKPSVETLFHAWLLQLPEVNFVGHTHPVCVNQILCSPRAKEFAAHRVFPDQVVYCGTESVLVPYVDPGMVLSKHIAQEVEAFQKRTGEIPRIILLENHGVIALGSSAKQVEAALKMIEKAARVFVGAIAAGGPIFLPKSQVDRIAGRSDEHYRQKMLKAT